MIHYITTQGVGDAWVANELHGLDRSDIPYVLHAMRPPQRLLHASAWTQTMQRESRYLYPVAAVRFLSSAAIAPVLFGRAFFSGIWNALFGQRENWRARLAALAHFVVACHWARTLRHESVSHIHSQWAHSCATIGMYGAWLLGKPFSFTGHACDLFRDRVALRDKIRRAEFIVCISNFHREFYLNQGARPEQLVLVYCGIDPSIFVSKTDGEPAGGPFRILSSARLVEKKGLCYLVEACRIMMDQGVDLRCTIGGSGPLEQEIRDQVQRLGLSAAITITGTPIQQEDLPAFMHSGDVFCLPCVWAADRDVDGLPQMLMEAMACGLPVVATRLVGIPDLVIHEQTGLLVEPNNAEALAAALTRLYEDQELSHRVSQAGRQYVLDKFNISDCLAPLIARYQERLLPPSRVDVNEMATART